jgi:hypothetical protein
LLNDDDEAFNTYFLSVDDNIQNNKNQDYTRNKYNNINNDDNFTPIMPQTPNTAYPHIKQAYDN